MEVFKQQYEENISSNLVSSIEALKVLLQLLNSPDFANWGDEFIDQYQDEMKKDLEEDEEKAEVLLELLGYLGRTLEEDEDLDWIERKKRELEEFLSVIGDLKEFLPEDY